MIKLKSFFLVLVIQLALLFAGFQVSSQTSGEKTLLWEISGNGLQKPSYLFGTIHIMPKKEFQAFKTVDEKLKKSDQMVLEIDIDIPFGEKMRLAKMLMLPEGTSLKDYMNEDEFNIFKAYVLDTLDVKEMMFNAYLKMKPIGVYSALIPEIIGEKLVGYEMHFSKIAKRKKIPVRELESFEFQFAIFDSIPPEKQVSMFLLSEQNPKVEFDEMLAVYKNQDIYAMAESLKADESSSEFEEQLLIERNIDWIPKISAFVREGSSFIAVGAAHLAGEHGLIKLLREEGFEVKGIEIVK